jgi:hypothetical protein
MSELMLGTKKPRYSLFEYRKFIREAAPFISLIAGRRIRPSEADTMSDEALTELALRIDARVDDLKKAGPGPHAAGVAGSDASSDSVVGSGDEKKEPTDH